MATGSWILPGQMVRSKVPRKTPMPSDVPTAMETEPSGRNRFAIPPTAFPSASLDLTSTTMAKRTSSSKSARSSTQPERPFCERTAENRNPSR